jgi:hypothetical protein
VTAAGAKIVRATKQQASCTRERTLARFARSADILSSFLPHS